MANNQTKPVTLVGDGTWRFTAAVQGDDLVVNGVLATWFGGDSDPQDNGETASGVLTKGHPDCLGVALPMSGFAHSPETAGSPLPRFPWGKMGKDAQGNPIRVGTWVEVTNLATGAVGRFPVIDLGPAKSASEQGEPPHAIDLTPAAFRKIGGSIAAGRMRVNYRILGGARWAHK